MRVSQVPQASAPLRSAAQEGRATSRRGLDIFIPMERQVHQGCEGSGLRASRGLRLPSACAEGEEARGTGVDQKLQVALHPRAV